MSNSVINTNLISNAGNMRKKRCVMNANASIPVILIVTRNCRLSHSAIRFSLDTAERLGFRVLVVFVNTWPFFWDGGRRERMFCDVANHRIHRFKQIAAEKNVAIDYVLESGKISKVIHRLCRLVRKLEFIVLDQGIQEYSAATATVPVFSLRKKEQVPVRVSPAPETKGHAGWSLSQTLPERTGKFVWVSLQAIFLISLYVTFFVQADSIMEYWTRGGCYGVLPALTAWFCCYLQYSLIDSCKSLTQRTGSTMSRRWKARSCIYEPTLNRCNSPSGETRRTDSLVQHAEQYDHRGA